jgi:hypothetical protein
MEKISTRRLDLLPDIDKLKRVCQSILISYYIFTSSSREFDIEKHDETIIYSYDNGSSDFYKIFFDSNGSIIIGYTAGSLMNPLGGAMDVLGYDQVKETWPGLLDNLPQEFNKYRDMFIADNYDENGKDIPRDNKDFVLKYTITYCIWRRYNDSKWNIGNIDFTKAINYPPEPDLDPDSSEEQLYIFSENYHNFVEWINNFYENVINKDNIKWIKYIFDHKPLKDELIIEINQHFSEINELNFLKRENEKIGYPIIEKI